ncbi:MAG: hypothetical protein DRJ66_07820 [Thermoprotei archaeon]|nr:MAG: hypothetical protein DRJ66_07820 [Thermoprotei archaeon]RLF19139.1 MAG: hypothetical protein DRZ82_06685 [Thermoprotei archaeon]
MMFFVDATIFIKWVSASPKALSFEAALSGYVLYKISRGTPALTTTLVKDEVMIWLSRYRASKLEQFLKSLKALASLKIVAPLQKHEEEAVKMYGKYPLGISDLINLSVMKSYNIKVIYSTDKGFDSVPWVKRIFKELAQEGEFTEFLSMLKDKGVKFSFIYKK